MVFPVNDFYDRLIKQSKALTVASLIAVGSFSQKAYSSDFEAPLKAGDSDSEVVYWYRNFDMPATQQLLQLLLDKTADLYGRTTVRRGPEMTQGRAIHDLENGDSSITLINVVPDREREHMLRPIYVASDDGLVGLRVCMIHNQDQAKFNGIRSISDLNERGIIFGQGAHWPDSAILESNGLKVIRAARFENLFAMLRGQRFNCFLRGIGEVSYDLASYGGDDLTTENSLLFSYPSASVFFVRKNNIALATRLELGLRRVLLDGSYADYFKAFYQQDLEKLDLHKRRVIRLNNSLMSDEMLLKTSEKLNLYDGKLEAY